MLCEDVQDLKALTASCRVSDAVPLFDPFSISLVLNASFIAHLRILIPFRAHDKHSTRRVGKYMRRASI